MTRKTRVRFAPSPTGPLHIGGVRTALYNYLYAKKRGGNFILRIEDTDSQRFVPGAEEYIINALAWCGITPDEGVVDGKIAEVPDSKNPFAPYRQSQRREIYHSYALELIQKGFAYYAFDSSEKLEAMRSEAESKGETFTYNYTVRESLDTSLKLSAMECEERLQNGDQWVVRFKMPVDKIIKMRDLIRGDIEVNSSTLDDKVLWKAADRLPTYHLANVVDDKLMEISDVIRGEEWLPSLPLHYMLYEAFGWNDIRPNFAHLSLLLKPDGKGKLSKRDGERLGFPVFPLEWRNDRGEISKGYREEGYYPEAFINLLAFLGWNPGTEQELFSLEELTESFSLERVVKSGAKFNPEKAKWFNQEYLRKKSTEELVREFLPLLESKGVIKEFNYVASAVEMIRERASFVNEFWGLCDYLFCAPQNYDMKVKEKFWREDTPAIINELVKELASVDPFTKESLEVILPSKIKERGWQMGAVMNSLRLLLVGESKGASVADIMALIGKKESLSRLEKGLSVL
ncbi:MAG: glutamate--tRNA ligase [Bacteroidetes bacterium HGW-Bacteroidetes-8]|jgi:glutamyl-tRNA synthetase|nr:MAG: glutamate--tRNA ligase [Bacteroidetes bacterium HGW-Bacteroidetes-8]